MNYLKNLMTRLSVSVGVVMAVSVTVPLIEQLEDIDFKSGVELIINANQY